MQKVEAVIESKSSSSVAFKHDLIRKKSRNTTFALFFIFIVSIAIQCVFSFDKHVLIRLEFLTQAIFYFTTLLLMVLFTRWLVNLIKRIFGNGRSGTLHDEID